MLMADFTIIVGAVLYTFTQFFVVMDEIIVFEEYGMSLLDLAVTFGFLTVTIDFYLWIAYGRFAVKSVTK